METSNMKEAADDAFLALFRDYSEPGADRGLRDVNIALRTGVAVDYGDDDDED